MPRTALTIVTPTRSPERERLAGTIAERARVKGLLSEREATKQAEADSRLDLQVQARALEARLRQPHVIETVREQALMAGEDVSHLPTVASVKAELQAIEDRLRDSREVEQRLDADCVLIAARLQLAEAGVQEAVTDVLVSEVDRDGLIRAHSALARRAAFLARAIRGPGSAERFGQPRPYADLSVVPASLPPCPWQAAADRLDTDPDAEFPGIEDALSLADVPGPTFPNAA